jgi:hypothetical protein
MHLLYRCLMVIVVFSSFHSDIFGQTADTSKQMTVTEVNAAKQNPVSGLKSIYLQDVVLPVGTGNANSFSVQPVYPFHISEKWKLITYTIIPIQYLPPLESGTASASGLGNVLFNGYFSPVYKEKKTVVWGFGPAIQFPTRTNTALGSNRLSAGPAALLYVSGATLSGGIVAQNIWSLGGTGANQVNLLSLQYILFYNFPSGWFLESNATTTANWLAVSSDIWTVPVGGGPGKTFQIGKGKSFYSAALQGFYNVVRPDFVGNWMIVAQFQFIFSM